MTAQSPITGHLTPEDVARAGSIGRLRGTIGQIVREVSAETGIPACDIMGRSRKSAIAQARFLCWFVARQRGMSLQQIARVFDRDHSTVLHGIRREAEERGVQA